VFLNRPLWLSLESVAVETSPVPASASEFLAAGMASGFLKGGTFAMASCATLCHNSRKKHENQRGVTKTEQI
jgi:hypothetical protein